MNIASEVHSGGCEEFYLQLCGIISQKIELFMIDTGHLMLGQWDGAGNVAKLGQTRKAYKFAGETS
jgi:hypothetical protein